MEELRMTRLKSRVSLVVSLSDAYTGAAPVGLRDMQVQLEGIRSKAIGKSDGSYIFSDLQEGDYRLLVHAEHYFALAAPIRVDANHLIQHLSLQPLPSYPFQQGTTLIRLGLRDEAGRPVAGAQLTAAVLTEDCVKARLMQDRAEPGTSELAVGSLTGRIGIGDLFTLRGRGLKEVEETVRIAQVLEYQKRFLLDKPLTESYARGALLLPVAQSCSTANGEAVIALAGCRVRTFQVRLEITPANGGNAPTLVKEVMVEEGQATSLGTVVV
ncbi:hypothetical protein B5M42_016920 [Paenibacillus athensensis]|uniref:Carboxypeptidase regulatory-like domain-containing protein n=1 Tax=Paenibacillus athensensis TaxID=1967502 RepID=A0A4Y8PST2_9BACL|nr:hypothetical protein [Paenibacillus athensensis]MCD1260485.1 hypothetical protein [Paenibacillus athensensis]